VETIETLVGSSSFNNQPDRMTSIWSEC